MSDKKFQDKFLKKVFVNSSDLEEIRQGNFLKRNGFVWLVFTVGGPRSKIETKVGQRLLLWDISLSVIVLCLSKQRI